MILGSSKKSYFDIHFDSKLFKSVIILAPSQTAYLFYYKTIGSISIVYFTIYYNSFFILFYIPLNNMFPPESKILG